MQRKRGGRSASRSKSAHAKSADSLRIIGGELRGRPFRYNGDPCLRPMKERVREAVFNLLGPAVKGSSVIDLFAGTGAMSLEAISRGARSATLVERRFPNVRLIQENAKSLGVVDRVAVQAGDTFVIHDRLQVPDNRWLVFCCPPYDFYDVRRAELLEVIKRFCHDAPARSLIVVEADQRFDFKLLPDASAWDVRTYAPAVIGIYDKTE